MKTYVLLFRGINVGGKNILPMKDLSALLINEGCMDVKTYIQSGNVVLKAKKKPGEDIKAAIEKSFGFKPELMVLEKSDFLSAVENNPYRGAEGKAVHLYFTKKAPTPDADKLLSLAMSAEKFELKGKIFYLYAPEGIGRSKLVVGLEKCLGVPATGRNLNTDNKISAMLDCL